MCVCARVEGYLLSCTWKARGERNTVYKVGESEWEQPCTLHRAPFLLSLSSGQMRQAHVAKWPQFSCKPQMPCLLSLAPSRVLTHPHRWQGTSPETRARYGDRLSAQLPTWVGEVILSLAEGKEMISCFSPGCKQNNLKTNLRGWNEYAFILSYVLVLLVAKNTSVTLLSCILKANKIPYVKKQVKQT